MKISVTKTQLALAVLYAVQGCTAAGREAIAKRLRDVALEVCVEGDTVTLCAIKCAEASETKDLP